MVPVELLMEEDRSVHKGINVVPVPLSLVAEKLDVVVLQEDNMVVVVVVLDVALVLDPILFVVLVLENEATEAAVGSVVLDVVDVAPTALMLLGSRVVVVVVVVVVVLVVVDDDGDDEVDFGCVDCSKGTVVDVDAVVELDDDDDDGDGIDREVTVECNWSETGIVVIDEALEPATIRETDV